MLHTDPLTFVPKSDATNAYDLLTDVIQAILEEPKRFCMLSWRMTKGAELFNELQFTDPDGGASRTHTVTYPRCGTVGCIAGWIYTLAPKTSACGTISTRAREIIGGSMHGPLAGAVDSLFYKFYESKAMPQSQQYAEDYAVVIREFQAKWERELREVRI